MVKEAHGLIVKHISLCFLQLPTFMLQRSKVKFWYVRLSPNHKVFHYGDCDEKSTPALEELPNKLAVQDVKALITGKECPHMKESR